MKTTNQIFCALLTLTLLGACSAPDQSGQVQTEQKETSVSEEAAVNQNQTDTSKDDEIEFPAEKVSEKSIQLDDYKSNIELNGTEYSLTGNLEGMIIVDSSEQVTLNLNDATITSTGPGIYIRNAKSVTLIKSGENVVKSVLDPENESLNAAIYSKDDLVLKGDGQLQVAFDLGHGIKTKDTFVSEGGTLVIDASQDAIHSNETMHFLSGDYVFNVQDEGIQSEEDLLIENGSFVINSVGDCIRAENSLVISGGEFNLNSTQNEGIESKNELLISGGNILVDSHDDCLNAANSITISGGVLNLVSQTNDCVDSNGSIEISGGDITAIAIRTPEGAFDTDNTPFIIAGGKILGIGPNYTAPTQVEQNCLVIGGSGNIETVTLTSQGQILFEKENVNSDSAGNKSIFVSTDSLTTGSEVEVYVNGNLITTVVIEKGVTKVGQISSMGGPGGFGQNRMPF